MESYKRIGILGGLSPESTVIYYEHITRRYYERFGDYSYPEIIIFSVNFQEFIALQEEDRWGEIADRMVDALYALHRAGADFAVIATNTMHMVFEEVEKRSPIPLISIIDATAEAIKKEDLGRVGLLGTLTTMRKTFYRDGLRRHGIEVIVPGRGDQEYIDRVIYEELVRGEIRPEAKEAFLKIIENLKRRGAKGVVLGCTEIPLLIKEEDSPLRLFNTSIIHAERALEYAITQ